MYTIWKYIHTHIYIYTIQHTLFECPAFAKERDTFLERLYELHPIARGLSPEGHCDFLMGDVLPRETENTVYRYLTAISTPVGHHDRAGRRLFIYLFIYPLTLEPKYKLEFKPLKSARNYIFYGARTSGR